MRAITTILFALATSILLAQPAKNRMSQADYIEKYKDEAIKEMRRSGVPASITLAQGILESGNGNSSLARKANNHFGIKCHSDWNGDTYIQDDDRKNECFRKYKHVLESYRDHSEFLKKPRYAFLFELKPTDYKGWAHGLKKAGYATNPKYPRLLIDIIEKNELYQYDEGYKRKKHKDLAKDDEIETPIAKPSASSTSALINHHKVKVHENHIRYIETKEGDNFEDLAQEFNMGLWQFYKYNDLKEGDAVPAGIIYLQPKRGRAQADSHTVAEGETLWDISQMHGIKMKKLLKRNGLEEGDKVKAGTVLKLR
ncbi:MAG: glycoside hydrolase [Flavobacteriales bacterium]|nr:glycoside hydrolase [Flavobacteriales bacterium]